MGKILPVSKINNFSKDGEKIVLAGGCFDIIHIGHIEFLKNAKAAGDILVLLLESDESIKKLKGEKRPINNQENRSKILSSIQYVDYVIPLPRIYKTQDYNDLVLKIKPTIIAITSGDPNLENKKHQAKSVNGKIKVVLKKMPDHSTTKLLNYF